MTLTGETTGVEMFNINHFKSKVVSGQRFIKGCLELPWILKKVT